MPLSASAFLIVASTARVRQRRAHERARAAGVHLLTATGAAFALLALIAAKRGDWQLMFIWLGVALIVDTVDGPLARRVGVVKVLPRFSGERLDLIVDFLTYVAVPAFALSQSDLLSEAFRSPAGIAVILSSLFHRGEGPMSLGRPCTGLDLQAI